MSTESTLESSNETPSRRSVLGTIGTTAAAGVTLSGVASASRDVSDVEPEALDNANIESFRGQFAKIESEVNDLLEKLDENDHVDGTEIDVLDFDGVEGSREASRELLNARMSTPPEGKFLAYETLLPSDQFDSDIKVSMRPDQGVAAAAAKLDDELFVLNANQDEFVSTNSDQFEADCSCGGSCGSCQCPYGEPQIKECNGGSAGCDSDTCLSDACCNDDGGW